MQKSASTPGLHKARGSQNQLASIQSYKQLPGGVAGGAGSLRPVRKTGALDRSSPGKRSDAASTPSTGMRGVPVGQVGYYPIPKFLLPPPPTETENRLSSYMTDFNAKQQNLEVERMEKDASLNAEIDMREKEFYSLQAQGMQELKVSTLFCRRR